MEVADDSLITIENRFNQLRFDGSSNIVQTASAVEVVRQLIQAILMEVPIIVQGDVGCGKSFLIRELARVFDQADTVVELSLDDQSDSKTLFGSYVCSDIPGEFVWQAGVLTLAAMKGYWLLIEDIDKVPIEVVSSMMSLLESREIQAPMRPQGTVIPVHQSFRIFGTRTMHGLKSSTKVGGNGLDYIIPTMKQFSFLWHFVSVPVPDAREIRDILTARFSKLIPIVVEKLLDTYRLFSRDKSIEIESSPESLCVPDSVLAKIRRLTLRDLMKVAARIQTNVSNSFNVTANRLTDAQRRLCVAEIVEVYVVSVRDRAAFQEACVSIGKCWGISEADIETYIILGCPQLQTNIDSSSSSNKDNRVVTIGRITVGMVSENEVTVSNDQSSVGQGKKRSSSGSVVDKQAVVKSNLPVVVNMSQQFAYSKYSLRLLEKVAASVTMSECVLLVGETGSGKTTSVQQLASLLGKKLVVQNLSLSTDSADLIGGYRPVSIRHLLMPCYERFMELFLKTFEGGQNKEYLDVVANYMRQSQWKKLIKAFINAAANASKRLSQSTADSPLLRPWNDFDFQCQRLQANMSKIDQGFAFAYVDGLLVEAMKNGDWLLLDEINLASSETLQALAGILDGQSKLCLSDRGSADPVMRHKDFRVFAAMNPPTDVGKKELPVSLRCRFTEIYTEELVDPQDLCLLVQRYLDGISEAPIQDVVSVYLGCRATSELGTLVDGAGQRPRYSLRSLTRSLRAGLRFMFLGMKPINRALYEGFLLNFQTLLGESSRVFMKSYLSESFNISPKSFSNSDAPPSRPGGKKANPQDWVLVKPFWLHSGPLLHVDWSERNATTGITKFVMTKSIEGYIRDITAAIAADVAPILIQGPTSVGKTTMIEFLAARTGHRCVRINNHEHTDVAEYIGSYVTNLNGQLEFKDGLLVEALRKGHWIILDELNLAPSDVLEALNRLLDDNKELLIPETGELVHPAPGFFLFATQNPPGAYGGRKPLSRAFRNRFLELSVCDLPLAEVEEIVTHSCGIPTKFSKMLVKTMHELQLRRHQTNLFQGKYGMVTTRDLIKWGNRKPQSAIEVASEGYMLLAEKLREEEQRQNVLNIINEACQTKLDPSTLYAMHSPNNMNVSSANSNFHVTNSVTEISELVSLQDKLRKGELEIQGVRGIAVTATLRRLWKLVGSSVAHNEPALLIGGTGSGKTTVCQLIAAHRGQNIRILNCHQSTETADIIGGLRPVRMRVGILHNLLLTLCPNLFGRLEEFVVNFENIVTSIEEGELKQSLPQLVEVLQSGKDSHATLVALMSSVDATSNASTVSDDEVKKFLDVVISIIRSVERIKELIAKQQASQSEASSSSSSSNSSKKKAKKAEPVPVHPSQILFPAALNAISEIVAEHSNVQSQWSRYRSLFEWHDGPLIEAMKNGDIFLLDEINLAEDAVIERLNSVLESGRSITLAERGGDSDAERIIAHPNFKFLATMNPGGDFGKRELSPALRSRFTEYYVQELLYENDVILILCEILSIRGYFLSNNAGSGEQLEQTVAGMMYQFMNWLNERIKTASSNMGVIISVREILAWASFVSKWTSLREVPNLSEEELISTVYLGVLHGAYMVLLDGLGIGSTADRESIVALKRECELYLLSSCPESLQTILREAITAPTTMTSNAHNLYCTSIINGREANSFKLGSFGVALGSLMSNKPTDHHVGDYVVDSNNTLLNLWRVLRAMQIGRPILLEGPPGVGKTSLIANLAKISGHRLIRINLSEHSEIADLLGSDLPSSDRSSANSPKFVWCDGIFLTAMKQGDWVLLDELNLAPQSVLEGLNACLDHRSEVFLPEIGQTVKCAPSFRVFCAQNPMIEGGGRKGLPQSFLSRFSKVFVDSMTEFDMQRIANLSFLKIKTLPKLNPILSGSFDVEIEAIIALMVKFVNELQFLSVNKKEIFAREGSPWEFNLRDVLRWIEFVKFRVSRLSIKETSFMQSLLSEGAYLLFICRLRSRRDRLRAMCLFKSVFDFELNSNLNPIVFVDSSSKATNQIVFGLEALPIMLQERVVDNMGQVVSTSASSASLSGGYNKVLETIAICVNHRWPMLLIGSAGKGKRFCVKHLARAIGVDVKEFSASSSTDATELLGSFEQENNYRYLYRALNQLDEICKLFRCELLQQLTARAGDLILSSEAVVVSIKCIQEQAEQIASSDKLKLVEGKSLFEELKSLGATISCFIPLIERSEPVLSKLEICITAFHQCVDKCYQLTFQASHAGFEWVDGVVVDALKNGHWLLIDNVNLCSASVLDRLNSILEPKGTLLLTENGMGEVISAHPNFRIFFAMDSRFGEISRAMRNRCVEMYFPDLIDSDVAVMHSFSSVQLQPSTADQFRLHLLGVYDYLALRSVVGSLEHSDFISLSELIDKLKMSSPSKTQSFVDPLYPRYKLVQRLEKLLSVVKAVNQSDSQLNGSKSIVLQDAIQTVFPFLKSIEYGNASEVIEECNTSSSEFVSVLKIMSSLMQLRSTTNCNSKVFSLLYLLAATTIDSMAIRNQFDWIDVLMKSSLLREWWASGGSGGQANARMSQAVALYGSNGILGQEGEHELSHPKLREAYINQLIWELFWQFSEANRVVEFLQRQAESGNYSVLSADELNRIVHSLKLLKEVDSESNHVISLVRVFSNTTNNSCLTSVQTNFLSHSTNSMFYLTLHCDSVRNSFNSEFAKAIWTVFEVVVLRRFQLLLRELQQQSDVASRSIWNGVPLNSNYYFLSVAVRLEKFSANSADLRFLVTLKRYLDSVDNLILELVSIALTCDCSQSDSSAILLHVTNLIEAEGQRLLCYRDVVTSLLLSTVNTKEIKSSRSDSKSELNWEQLSVVFEWLVKATNQFLSKFLNLFPAEQEESYKGIFQRVRSMITELKRLDFAVGAFFGSELDLLQQSSGDMQQDLVLTHPVIVVCHALRIVDSPSRKFWIQSGHPAVPTSKSDWAVLYQLYSIGKLLHGTLSPPHYLESSPNLVDVSLLASSTVPLQLSSKLKNEFVSLLSTFYYSKTNESDRLARPATLTTKHFSSAVNGDVDFERLLIAFSNKIKNTLSGYFTREINDNAFSIESFLDYDFRQSVVESANGSDAFLLLSDFMRQCIDAEVERGGAIASASVLETFIAKLFIQVSNSLGLILLGQANKEVVPKLRQLSEVLELLIAVIYRYSLFGAECARELQSLLWCTESEIQQIAASNFRLSSKFITTVRSVQNTIELRLQYIMSHGLFNCIDKVSFQFGSQTLHELLIAKSMHSVQLRRSVASASEEELSRRGPIKLLQCIDLEMTMRHLDIAAAVPLVLKHASNSKLLLFDALTASTKSNALPSRVSASLFISESQNARKKLLQLCRHLAFSGNTSTSSLGSPRTLIVSEYGRLSQLLLHVVDIVALLPNYSISNAHERLNEIKESTYANFAECVAQLDSEEAIQRLISHIRNLEQCNLFEFVADYRLQKTIATHFQALLRLLSEKSLYTCTENKRLLLLGKCWTYVGLIRTSILLPLLPIDPAVSPATKAKLLSQQKADLIEASQMEQLASVLGQGATMTDSMVEMYGNAQLISGKIEKLQFFAIERPADSANYEDLFNFLQSIHKTFCSSDSLKKFISIESIRVKDRDSLIKEELMWQESLAAAMNQLEVNFASFIDITHPFSSGLCNISYGLRTIIGFVHSSVDLPDKTSTASASSSASASGASSVQRWWSDVFRYPMALNVVLDDSQAIKHSIGSSVRGIVEVADAVVERAAYWHKSRSADSSACESNAVTTMRDFVPHLAMIFSMMKLEYHIGGEAVPLTREHLILFNEIISQFVQLHLKKEAEQKQKDAEKAALFRNRIDEKVYETNEEKEEEEALKLHFPDHLAELTSMLSSAVDPMAADNEDEAAETAMEDDASSGASSLDGYSDDFHSICSLIGLHCRMIFVHAKNELENQNQIWKRNTLILPSFSEATSVSSTKSVKARKQLTQRKKAASAASFANNAGLETKITSIRIEEGKEYFSKILFDSSLLLTKAVSRSLDCLFAPYLDGQLRGGCLMLLSTVAERARCKQTGADNSPSAAFLQSLLFTSSSSAIRCDRDLLYILDPLNRSITQNMSETDVLDFNTDPNPDEILLACEPLNAMFIRASELLAAFPGNEFLLQVCKLAARINYFHISTPVGKMLSSLELLLRKAEEWEQFAASTTSLRTEMKLISNLIERWRRLELQSWENLLRSKELTYVKQAMQHWYSLSFALHSIPELVSGGDAQGDKLSTSSQHEWAALGSHCPPWLLSTQVGQQLALMKENRSSDEVDKTEGGTTSRSGKVTDKASKGMTAEQYLNKIFDLVDGFLRSAVVGQFAARLHLVRLFALQLQQQKLFEICTSFDSNNKINKEVSARVANIVYSIWQYYEQYLPIIREFQDKLKTPIQDKLRDQSKLGKWDQLNTYAVIEYSERIHRKLNKLIREYQIDVLDFPAFGVIRRDIMRDLVTNEGDLKGAIAVPTLPQILPHLSALGDAIDMSSLAIDQDDKADEANGADIKEQSEQPEGDNESEVSTARKLKCKVSFKTTEPISEECIHFRQLQLGFDDSAIPDLKAIVPNIFDSAAASSSSSVSRLQKTPALLKKLDGYVMDLFRENCDSDFSATVLFGKKANQSTDMLCSDIFMRIQELRQPSATKPMKQRAIADLLSGLKSQGISHLKSTIPPQVRSMLDIMNVSPLLSCEFAGDLNWFSDNNSKPKDSIVHDTISQAERYYSRNIAEISQLRTQAAAPFSHDISNRELNIMLGLSENLFYTQIRMRSALTASLSDAKTSLTEFERIRRLLELTPEFEAPNAFQCTPNQLLQQIANQKAAVFYLSYLRPACHVVVDNLVQLKRLVSSLSEANASQNIEEVSSVPAVDKDVCRAAEAVVNALLDVFMSVIVLPDEVNMQEIRLLNHAPLLLSLSKCSTLTYETVQSMVFQVIPKGIEKFNTAFTSICSLLSTDVVLPVAGKLEELMVSSKAQFQLNCSVPTLSNHHVAMETNEDGQNGSRTATVFSQCLDHCLVAVQNLQRISKLRLQSSGSASSQVAAGNELTVRGCFGEIFVLQSERPNQSVASADSQSEAVDASFEGESSDSLGYCWSANLLALSSIAQSCHKLVEAFQTISVLTNAFNQADLHSEEHIQRLSELHALAHAVLPLARRIISALLAVIDDSLLAYKSIGKFLYITVRIFRTLLAKGICSDNAKDGGEGDGEGDGTGDMEFTDDVEGTGMGEGEGKKDVSDQIQNEEQLMDLKNDNEGKDDDGNQKQTDKKLSKEEAEQGVEMSQDFDGEMYDLPEDDANQDDNEDDNEDETEELDREMGQNDEQDIVDEKQWDDEDGEGPDDKDNEKFEKDSKMEGDELEGEMRTKDEGEDEGDQDDGDDKEDTSKKDKSKAEDGDEGEEDNNEEKINKDLEDKEQEKPQGVDVRENNDDDGDEEQDQEDGTDNQTGPDEEQGAKDGEAEEEFPDDMKFEGNSNDGSDDDVSDKGEDNADETSDNENEPEPMEEDSSDVDDDGHSDNPDDDLEDQRVHGDGGNVPDVPMEQNDDDALDQADENPIDLPNKKKERRQPTYGVSDKSGADSVIPDGPRDEQSAEQREREDEPSASEGAKGEGSSGSGDGRKDGAVEQTGENHRDTNEKVDPNKSKKPPNPFNSKGDINQMWKKHLNLVDRDEDETEADSENKASEQSPPISDEKERNAGLFEKTQGDEKHTDQVLDAVDEAEAVHLDREQHEMDETPDEDDKVIEDDMEAVEPPNQDETRKKRDREQPSKKDAPKGRDEKRLKSDSEDPSQMKGNLENPDDGSDFDPFEGEEAEQEEEHPEALEDQEDPNKTVIFSEQSFKFGPNGEPLQNKKHGEVEDEIHDNEDFEYIGYDQAQALMTSDLSGPKKLWLHHRQVTETFSSRLCEQLRLILEPSLCSRLQGDYRTGKRINMRKVISYVSSGFRKDKIWLRRTKPAKREYQVMIMIDNSSSMGPAGGLALSSLCMIANALTRLEVGDLSVVSFADRVQIVHPFGKPFNDDCGSEVFSHFDFSADRTLLSESMEAVRPIFSAASSASSSSSKVSVTLQLCFVISDAKLDTDNRARLDSIVRSFAEQNVLVVLIVIDKTANPRDSIFNTKTVEFVDNKVVTKPYLENFPFPYYVAIQKIDNLPEVLSDALKQWFEMIANQMNT